MAQPLLVLLKKQHPQIMIDILAPKWVAPVLAQMPEVDKVRSTDFVSGKLQLRKRWQIAKELRQVGYERAYVLPNSAKSALIPWFAGIRLRIGYQGEHRYGLLNVRHANVRRSERLPMVHRYAALAYAPGAALPNILPSPYLVVDPNKIAPLLHRLVLDPDLPLIAFCPGAEYGSAKRWPSEHFATLARLIKRALGHAQIVALGSAKEAQLAQAIVDRAPFVRNLCGQTELNEACSLISHAHAVVSNDSGLMHIAAALRCPLVALFGSSDPRHTPPLSDTANIQWLQLACSPCFARECPLGHLKCLRELSPERVFNQLKTMLRL